VCSRVVIFFFQAEDGIRYLTVTGVQTCALPISGWLSSLDHSQDKVSSGTSSMVYELRVYHTYEGKLDDLLRRFREHTMRLFEKHGIRNVAYWTPIEEPLKGRTRSEEHTSELQSQSNLVC